MATVLDWFTYISLHVLATICDALPLSTAALVACVWRVSVALAGDVAVGYLVWLVWGFVSGMIWSSCPSFFVIFE